MIALSVRWPWSELIATGRKPFEVRTWKTKHRGPTLICSASSPSRDADAKEWLSSHSVQTPPVLGMALCVAELVDVMPFEAEHEDGACCQRRRCERREKDLVCLGQTCARWDIVRGRELCTNCRQPREYVWELRNVREVERVPVKGRLGLFEVEDGIIRVKEAGR